jgi:hypothetical protein
VKSTQDATQTLERANLILERTESDFTTLISSSYY